MATSSTMKDTCGICSTFLEGGEIMKDTGSTKKQTTFADTDDGIMQVESIVGSLSKLDSIAEIKEDAESESDEKKQEEEEQRESAKEEEMVLGSELPEPAIDNSQAVTSDNAADAATAVAAASPNATTSPKAAATNPVEEITVVTTTEITLERDFDKNPTDLYLSLMRKDWSAAIRRCADYPDEAKTWIYRREATGTLRWKLLPLHASIIFNAPVPVIDSLLHAHAAGAACKDDQGMVPLHLAIRMNSDQAVVEKLVAAQPDSVAAEDRKGRTPRALAEKQAFCPKKLLVIQTLENAGAVVAPKNSLSPQALAKAATAAASRAVSPTKTDAVAFASPKAAAEAKKVASQAAVEQLKLAHAQEVEKLIRESTAKQIQLNARIEVLEWASATDKMTISSLEETLKMVQESESELQSKIADMEATVAETIKDKNCSEDANKAVITNLVSQVGDLQNKLTAMTAERDAAVAAHADSEEINKQVLSQLKLKGSELERQLGQITFVKEEKEQALENAEKLIGQQQGKIEVLQSDAATLREKLSVTESKLEEVTISEQELAWKHHAMSVNDGAVVVTTNDVTNERIKALEREREDLRETVSKLSIKLYKVVGFLDEMVQEQEAIIAETLTRDSEMVPSPGSQEQEQQSEDRNKLLSNVAGMKEQIIGVIDSVIEGMPQTVDEEVGEKADTPAAVLL